MQCAILTLTIVMERRVNEDAATLPHALCCICSLVVILRDCAECNGL
jgi:hypothetical protein